MAGVPAMGLDLRAIRNIRQIVFQTAQYEHLGDVARQSLSSTQPFGLPGEATKRAART
jgi:hypothetical protein